MGLPRRFDHDQARTRHEHGETIVELAREYGVTEQSVSQAIKRAGGTVTRAAGATTKRARHIRQIAPGETCSAYSCTDPATHRLTLSQYRNEMKMKPGRSVLVEGHGAPVCDHHYRQASGRHPCSTLDCANPSKRDEPCDACAAEPPPKVAVTGRALTADELVELERRDQELKAAAASMPDLGPGPEPAPDPATPGLDAEDEPAAPAEVISFPDASDAVEEQEEPLPHPVKLEIADVLTRAALGILQPIGGDLRARGWDAGLTLHQGELVDGEYRWKVTLDIELGVRVPIEATTA